MAENCSDKVIKLKFLSLVEGKLLLFLLLLIIKTIIFLIHCETNDIVLENGRLFFLHSDTNLLKKISISGYITL